MTLLLTACTDELGKRPPPAPEGGVVVNEPQAAVTVSDSTPASQASSAEPAPKPSSALTTEPAPSLEPSATSEAGALSAATTGEQSQFDAGNHDEPVPGAGGSSASGGDQDAASGPSESTDSATPFDAGDPTSEAPVLDHLSVAVIGSSTAAGEGASSGRLGWVSLLGSALSERAGNGITVENLAVGGYTSAELVPGSGADGNIDEALDTGAELVIVALAGSNDLSNGTSSETLFERLAALRDASPTRSAVAFFLTTAPKDLGDQERAQLRAWAEDIEAEFGSCQVPGSAAAYEPCVIDVFSALANGAGGVQSEYSAGDGIHLNDAGHQRIFELALPVVEAYACSRVQCD